MSAQFSDDDIGKTVVNANGDEVGIVSAVEHGTAHVEPDPGITDTIKAKLGWEGTGEEAYPLQEQAVASVTDDEIRLEGDLSGAGSTHTGQSTGAAAGGTTGTRDTDVRDDDDDLIGDDDDDGLIGDDDDRRGRDRRTDDDDLIGDDDDSLIGDDDDDELIGDDDDDLIGDDDDEHRSRRDRDTDDDDII
ncbi:hypothetical protein [Natrononativus amylolyticus]|uniref:hypothetical protein n=1 Tax=Natrononativus amylolyticus TaxID=2963434 RepID=UPI0020CCA4FB|nr:hypothetical protein [Natrononativus amylolyticus]